MQRLVLSAHVLLLSGACYGALGVALGAFGAHGLKQYLSETAQATWETAVFYQLVHALALLAVGLWIRDVPIPAADIPNTDGLRGTLQFAGAAFVLGVLLFSGSLYVLALGGPKVLGPVTPLGGLMLIAGWIALIVAAVRGLMR